MPTYEEKIREFAQDMSPNSTKILTDLNDETFLGIVVKDTLETIQGVRNTPTLIAPIYIEEKNILCIQIKAALNPSQEVIIPIQLGNKVLENILINLSKGLGSIDVYYASNDLSVVWSTQILREPDKRIGLELELKKANLI